MDKTKKTDENVLYIIGWIFIGISGMVLLAYAFWPEWFHRMFPACFFHRLTGFYCMGCGGTRAFFSLVKGELWKSFLYHPLVIYVVGLGGWFMISHTIEKISKGKISIGLKYRDWYLWIALGLVGINFLIKNILLCFGVDVIAGL